MINDAFKQNKKKGGTSKERGKDYYLLVANQCLKNSNENEHNERTAK